MGGFKKAFKKVTKTVKKVVKPITKVVKKVVKTVKKVGKAVVKGVAKISNKLGPLGMIGLSIAMPYALGGLSSMIGTAGGTTGLMNSSNLFLKSIGTIGNSIRTGYQGFNTFVGNATSSITKSISNAFTRFAPKGTGNIFSRISQGAKNLYTAGKNKLKSFMPKPFTAKEGTVKFYDMDGVGTMTSTQAEAAITRGTLDPSMLGEQTLTETGGWFTKPNKIGVNSDRLVTETINDAYKIRRDGFGPNATRMFDDVKKVSLNEGTYINDEQIGSFIENNRAAKSYSKKLMDYTGDMDYYGTPSDKFQVKTEIADLAQTGDYTLGTARDRLEGTYNFTGNETFGKQEATKGFISRNKDKLKRLATAAGDTLLGPKPIEPEAPLEIPKTPMQGFNFNSMYSGTDIKGSGGGELIARVYGNAAANNIKDYYRNMNILNSGQTYA